MIGTDPPKLPYVIGADGAVVTRADLPPSNLKRWMPRRKATLVKAVRGGLIGLDEACQRYRLTKEEFAA